MNRPRSRSMAVRSSFTRAVLFVFGTFACAGCEVEHANVSFDLNPQGDDNGVWYLAGTERNRGSRPIFSL